MSDTPTDQPSAANGRASGKRRPLLLGLAAVVLLGVLSFVLYHFLYGRYHATTDDAYVDGNLVQITPQIAGTVTRIAVDDGDYVEAGQPLVWLDPSDTEVALQSAEANLARAVRQVRGLYSNVDALRAQLAARQAEARRAESDLKRRQALAKTGAIAREELDHARDAASTARSAVAAARQQLDTALALVDATAIASHPEVQAAAANLRQAYLAHARSTLPAPVAGYVAQRSVQVGSRVQPGTPLMAVVPLDEVWVDANFKETQLREMRLGQPVEITADLYGDDVRYHGVVDSLGVGTGSAFALLPAQNASGNWIKIVQRVPVRIRLEKDQTLARHPLRIGLSTAVDVDLHDQSGPQLAAGARTAPRYATDVYADQLAQANALIQQVISANRPQDAALAESAAERP